MRRREFITLLGGAAGWPLVARAQQTPRAARLGYLAPASNPDLQQVLLEALHGVGYVEGQSTPPALAAKRQTTTIPIIMAPAADPLRTGLVASLSRPEANVTGVSLYGSEIARKRMEIFKEAVVGIQRIAVLANVENPLHRFLWDDLQPVGPALGLQFRLFALSGLDKASMPCLSCPMHSFFRLGGR